MWTLHRPTDRHLLAVRLRQNRHPLSYPYRGCTRSLAPPPGFDADHYRVPVGVGPEALTAAIDALRRFAQFPPGWTLVDPAIPPIREGNVLCVAARVFGVWWVNACRIVTVIDEPRRYGFAYGTLPGHVEMGEERFLVEQTDDGVVWYDLLAHSRPRFWLTRLAYPLARLAQKRFARDSLAAMRAAVGRPAAVGAFLP
ncbi:MAG: DUF1990 domain-containing protein [Fimbriiglobus sp.]|jgi:uncharacterized protein (UPF0548 family)|nr:DUF1990 domain-containing protein [Fimbriiglobus sp.]